MSTELKPPAVEAVAGGLAENDQAVRYLSFTLGAEEYAIPLLTVREVIAVPEVTPIPFTPPHFLGIMNLRGQVISIVDLRQKLGIKPQPVSETAVIICDLAPLCLGVVVDSINSVLLPRAEELSAKPDIQSSKATDYITQIYRKDKKLVLLLDIQKTLGTEDYQMLAKAQKSKQAAAA